MFVFRPYVCQLFQKDHLQQNVDDIIILEITKCNDEAYEVAIEYNQRKYKGTFLSINFA